MKKQGKALTILLFVGLLAAGCSNNPSTSTSSLTSSSQGPVTSTSGSGSSGSRTSSSEKPTDEIPDAVNPTSDFETHSVSGTLHEINVDYNSDIPFVTNGTTNYKILYLKDDSYAYEAQKYLISRLFEATDCVFTSETINAGEAIATTTKVIAFVDETTFKNAGFDSRKSELGITGYRIATKDTAALIYCSGGEAYQLAVNKFLEVVVGYDCFYGEHIDYSRDGDVLPIMDITEKPDFDYRKCDDADSSWYYAANYTNNQVFGNTDGSGMIYHNCLEYLPPEVYYRYLPSAWSEFKVGATAYVADTLNKAGTVKNVITTGSEVTSIRIDFGNSDVQEFSYNLYNGKIYVCGDEYDEEHRKWYDDTLLADSVTRNKARAGGVSGQLCYTARGDETQFNEMVDACADNLYRYITVKNPNLYNITFTILDNHDFCTCDTCAAKKTQYGDAISATVILFLNEVDDIVQAKLEKDAKDSGTTKREFYTCFFAYQSYRQCPATKNASGEYEPILGIHTNEHVPVFIAPIESSFTHSYYENVDTTENESAAEYIKAWGSVSDRLYLWIYQCNFNNYLYPYCSWSAIPETLRYIKNCGGSLAYPQDEHTCNNRTVFSHLKLYINSKILVDCNQNVGDLIDKFFSKYYGKAGTTMRKYFDELRTYSAYQEKLWPDVFKGGIYASVDNKKYWNQAVLNQWVDYCDQALEEIAYLESEDLATYKLIRSEILTESISPRWILLTLFDTSYNAEDLTAERKKFKSICDETGVNTYKESGGNLSDIYANWGIA